MSTVEYYASLKEKEILSCSETCWNLKNVMLSDISHLQKNKCCMAMLVSFPLLEQNTWGNRLRRKDLFWLTVEKVSVHDQLASLFIFIVGGLCWCKTPYHGMAGCVWWSKAVPLMVMGKQSGGCTEREVREREQGRERERERGRGQGPNIPSRTCPHNLTSFH
jgi:hypothetical protein